MHIPEEESYQEEMEKLDRERYKKYKEIAEKAVKKLEELMCSDDEKTALSSVKEMLDRAEQQPKISQSAAKSVPVVIKDDINE